MTEIECLEKMVLVWRYLEEHPKACTKREAYTHYTLLEDLHFCPCCAFVNQFPSKQVFSCSEIRYLDIPNCDLCPLKDLWNDRWGDSLYCEVEDSAYNRWQSSNQKDSTAAAKEIADYSEQRLNALKEKE